MQKINPNDYETLILVLNPGSTSTKVALFDGDKEVLAETIRHSAEDISGFKKIIDQKDFRYNVIKKFISENGITNVKAVVGRGGLIRPVESGVYEVNQNMIDDLATGKYKEHASNLGGIIAHQLATDFGCKAYIVDPVVVDEMDEVARVSGMPELERKSIFHALNQKSSARQAAAQLGKSYAECNFIVAHMGGGVSVGAHCQGRVIDVNNALDGEGPFSPERTGGLPVGDLLKMCYEKNLSLADVKKKIVGKGGVVAYLGTNNMQEVEEMIAKGNVKAKLIYEALIYQISKEIAAHGATLKGKVDAVILTGGIAYNEDLVNKIKERINFLGQVIVIPGEREMVSLASNINLILQNKTESRVY
ncbi:MAG: butyrate kinase [Spirochaetes bacterium]|nr:butyrate kinase [Spirochaetota bacterium]